MAYWVSGKLGTSHLASFGKCLGKFLRMLPAGLGEVGLAAATAADNGGNIPDPVAGAVTFFDEVARDAGDEKDLSFPFGSGQKDSGGVHLLANLVDELPH